MIYIEEDKVQEIANALQCVVTHDDGGPIYWVGEVPMFSGSMWGGESSTKWHELPFGVNSKRPASERIWRPQ